MNIDQGKCPTLDPGVRFLTYICPQAEDPGFIRVGDLANTISTGNDIDKREKEIQRKARKRKERKSPVEEEEEGDE